MIKAKTSFAVMAVILQLWSMGLITYATVTVYSVSEHNMALATIYGSTTGILTIVTGYIQKRMSDLLNVDKPILIQKNAEDTYEN